jgi:hypothetical protein
MAERADDLLIKALRELTEEYHRATSNYPPMHSYHEGISVIEEEYDELWDEIKLKPSKRDPKRLREEAKQVAAMALRFMIDLT